MSSSPGPNDTYANVVSDASLTVTLANTVVDLVRAPITQWNTTRRRSKQLAASLGDWQKDVEYREDRVPVLRWDKFEPYLAAVEGRFEPKGMCSGTSGWAYLLHALDITSDKRIVGWRPAIKSSVITQNDGVKLEIDGTVFCHILNMFALPKEVSVTSLRRADLGFGVMSWTITNDEVHASFAPAAIDQLNKVRNPFPSNGLANFRLRNKDALWVDYLNTLELGCSDPSFAWPSIHAPIAERISKLVSNLKAIEIRQEPLLLTTRWFEDASRIRDRFLTRGGTDLTFPEAVYRHFHDSHLAHAERIMRAPLNYEYCFPTSRMLSSPDPRLLVNAMSKVLQSYSSAPGNSHKHFLYHNKGVILELARMLFQPISIYSSSILILEFFPGCDLWHRTIQLN